MPFQMQGLTLDQRMTTGGIIDPVATGEKPLVNLLSSLSLLNLVKSSFFKMWIFWWWPKNLNAARAQGFVMCSLFCSLVVTVIMTWPVMNLGHCPGASQRHLSYLSDIQPGTSLRSETHTSPLKGGLQDC